MLLVSKSISRIPFESTIRLSRQFAVIDSRVTQLAAHFQNACQKPYREGGQALEFFTTKTQSHKLLVLLLRVFVPLWLESRSPSRPSLTVGLLTRQRLARAKHASNSAVCVKPHSPFD